MDPDSKRLLEEHGYVLLKSDTVHGVWCFENKKNIEFSLDCPCVISSVMTF